MGACAISSFRRETAVPRQRNAGKRLRPYHSDGMSEYQFYEFAAVDQAVLEVDAPYPWSISSRAEVTPWRWRNVYNWGDFRGSTEKMMEFYDAHVYLANWGTFRFMLAFPEDMVSVEDVQVYASDESLDVYKRGGRTLLSWTIAPEDSTGEWVEGDGLLDQLLPIREELLRGDWRALYLGWLAKWRWWDDESEDLAEELQCIHEPPVPPGLGKLTCAQQELADRLDVDQDLLQAAAELEMPMPDRDIALQEAVEALSREELTGLLLRVAAGEGNRVSAELNRLARDDRPSAAAGQRRLGQLCEAARRHREKRLRREAEQKERRRRERKAKRKAHLQSLLERADAAWDEADSLAQHTSKTSYDQAAARVRELGDAYALAKRENEYRKRLNQFRDRHSRRPALLRRLADL